VDPCHPGSFRVSSVHFMFPAQATGTCDKVAKLWVTTLRDWERFSAW